MFRQKHLLLFFIVTILSGNLFAQNVTGYWQGEFSSDLVPATGRHTYFMTMALVQEGRKVDGVFTTSQMSYPSSPSLIYEISGRLGKRDSLPYRLTRGRILLDKIPFEVSQYFNCFDEIRYIKNDTAEILYGLWQHTGSISPRSDGAGGVFWVRRVHLSDSSLAHLSAEQKVLPNVIASPQPASTVSANTLPASTPTEKMMTRKKVEQGKLAVNTKNITLNIYDSADVDGDTVSIFLNGKLLIDHQLVSEKPITLNIELDEKLQSNELVLYAENLGSISPNTALIVVNAGDKRYEMFSKANLEENAMLIFEYNPK
jgi:hypothetical protein